MTSVADSLMERRGALVKDMQDLAGKAVEEGRDLSAEEQSKFDTMNAEVDALATRAQAILDGETRAKELEESFRKVTGKEPEDRGGYPKPSEFVEWARSARPGESYEVRAMAVTGGVGKDAVYSQLWEYAVQASEILDVSTVLNTADGNTVPVPVATVHSGTTAVTASSTIGTSDATITTVDLAVSKQGYYTLVPSELIQDAAFDLEGYLSRSAGRALGLGIAGTAAAAAVAGFTTAGVTGLSTGLGAQTTAGQGTDYLVDLFHSVISPYRSSDGCAWAMADSTAALVRKLKTNTGEPVWEPSLKVGDPDLVLGKPVKIVPSGIDAWGAAQKPIFFGDFKALWVRVAGGVRFERSSDVAFANDQVAFRALVRTGAVTVDPNAVKHFVTAS